MIGSNREVTCIVAAGLAVLAVAVSGWVLFVLTDPEPPLDVGLNAGEVARQACGAPKEEYFDLTWTTTLEDARLIHEYSVADGDYHGSETTRDLYDDTVLSQSMEMRVGGTFYNRYQDQLGNWGEWKARVLDKRALGTLVAESIVAYPGCPMDVDVSDSVFGRETSRSSGHHIILPTTVRDSGFAETHEIWVDSSGRLIRSIFRGFQQGTWGPWEGDLIVEKEWSGFGEPNIITAPIATPTPTP